VVISCVYWSFKVQLRSPLVEDRVPDGKRRDEHSFGQRDHRTHEEWRSRNHHTTVQYPSPRAVTQHGIADVSRLGDRKPQSAALAHPAQLQAIDPRLEQPSVYLLLLIYHYTYGRLPSQLGTSWREGLRFQRSPTHRFWAHHY